VWRGVAWRGVAWRGVAWRGVAWRGEDLTSKLRRAICTHSERVRGWLEDGGSIETEVQTRTWTYRQMETVKRATNFTKPGLSDTA
jgi:hypothetical protein